MQLTVTQTAATDRHETPLGTLWSTWTSEGLYRLSWEMPVVGRHGSSRRSDELSRLLDRFFDTGQASFEQVVVDSTGWTEFRRAVYRHCRKIASGDRITYKQLAAQAGNEKASRAVGSAMAKNRVPIVIPCHRVVACSGKLHGFSAPGGLRTKQFLLDLEGQGCPQEVNRLAAATV